MTKSDAVHAEWAAEHYAREVLGCVRTRRAIRSVFNKVDFFGCDVIGKCEDGSTMWIQVTSSLTTNNVAARRRKLETFPWNVLDGVYVFHMKKIDKVWYFIVHRWFDREWVVDGLPYLINTERWFKPFKEGKETDDGANDQGTSEETK